MKMKMVVAWAMLTLGSLGCDDGATGPNPPPVDPPPTVSAVGRVAFVSTRDGDPHVYVIAPDGTGLTRVAQGEAPAWSPDGNGLAFHRGEVAGTHTYVVGADGSGERLLAEHAAYPAWSPDGRVLAFERSGEIFVISADGTGEELLVGLDALATWTGVDTRNSYVWATRPAWSPDGRYLAIVFQHGWDEEQVLVLKADGSGPREGTPLQTGLMADWAPDGTRLALSRRDYRIASAGVDGTGFRMHALAGDSPRWSGDGTNFVFNHPGRWSCWDPGCAQSRIFVADPTNDRRARLVPDAVAPAQPLYNDYDPVWTRDHS